MLTEAPKRSVPPLIDKFGILNLKPVDSASHAGKFDIRYPKVDLQQLYVFLHYFFSQMVMKSSDRIDCQNLDISLQNQ